MEVSKCLQDETDTLESGQLLEGQILEYKSK